MVLPKPATRCSDPLATLIYISSVTNLDHYHGRFFVIDVANDPIVSLPHPIPLLS
jgi:hypothetical protein